MKCVTVCYSARYDFFYPFFRDLNTAIMGKERCVCGRVGSGMGVLELTLAVTPPGRVVTWEQLNQRRFPRVKHSIRISQAASRYLAVSPSRAISRRSYRRRESESPG